MVSPFKISIFKMSVAALLAAFITLLTTLIATTTVANDTIIFADIPEGAGLSKGKNSYVDSMYFYGSRYFPFSSSLSESLQLGYADETYLLVVTRSPHYYKHSVRALGSNNNDERLLNEINSLSTDDFKQVCENVSGMSSEQMKDFLKEKQELAHKMLKSESAKNGEGQYKTGRYYLLVNHTKEQESWKATACEFYRKLPAEDEFSNRIASQTDKKEIILDEDLMDVDMMSIENEACKAHGGASLSMTSYKEGKPVETIYCNDGIEFEIPEQGWQ